MGHVHGERQLLKFVKTSAGDLVAFERCGEKVLGIVVEFDDRDPLLR